jgi:Pro-kumamolisin, activation domain
MKNPLRCLVVGLLSLFAFGVNALDRQALRGHVPAAVPRLQSLGRLSGTNRLDLAVGLPLRNRLELANLLRQLYDPTSPAYRHFLTPDQFAQSFGPAEADYQAVIASLEAGGLTVTRTHDNRMLVDVAGTVAAIETAFQINLRVYQHPREARTFFAPDVDPSVDHRIRVLHIAGLDNYALPLPRSHRQPAAPASQPIARDGSGPSASYLGADFRTAYVPGISLTGTGQALGLVEFDGYYPADITAYEKLAGLTSVPLKKVSIDGFDGIPDPSGSGNEEVALDIEMAISMAPGLSQVLVYECSPSATTANVDDMFNRMATDNLAKQLSCSWGFDVDSTSRQVFQQFAAQGQSFFVASGDAGAFTTYVDQPADDPFLTIVGGTTLTTDATHHWAAETTWYGSGGGFSSIYQIPAWQQGIDMSLNQGSTTLRNLPDVAMVADNVWQFADNGQSFTSGGTSVSTVLWAAFTALVNQQGAASGKPPVGFLNPALYAVGKSASYSQCFHDITTGDNTSSTSPNLFHAVPGFDLCTGWGSPNVGTNLINALLAAPAEPLLITPPLAFIAQGPVGGPFTVTAQTYTLTNTGTASLKWSVGSTSPWFNVAAASGPLAPGGPPKTITVTLNPAASNLLLGTYTATVSFTNLNDHVVQTRQFTLLVGNPGFESGDFTYWNLAADTNNNFVDSIDATDLYGSPTLDGIDDSLFVHSGIYGAFLGENTALGSLSQSLPTIPGQHYLLSFWFDNPGVGTPNEFSVSWNGTTLFDQSNLGEFAWTNMHYTVSAAGTNTVLQFGFRNDQNAFGLDDVSVQPLTSIGPLIQTNGNFSFAWSTLPALRYQVQYTDDLVNPAWKNLGSPVTATGGTLSFSNPVTASPQRFYRILLP